METYYINGKFTVIFYKVIFYKVIFYIVIFYIVIFYIGHIQLLFNYYSITIQLLLNIFHKINFV